MLKVELEVVLDQEVHSEVELVPSLRKFQRYGNCRAKEINRGV